MTARIVSRRLVIEPAGSIEILTRDGHRLYCLIVGKTLLFEKQEKSLMADNTV